VCVCVLVGTHTQLYAYCYMRHARLGGLSLTQKLL
jgi:hypothetical protein